MSSARRKLFKGDCPNSWSSSETVVEKQIAEAVENCSTEVVEYTVVNEGDATPKGQILENPHGMKNPQESVFRPVTPSLSAKDLGKKVLVIHEGNEDRLRKTWTGLKRLEKMAITTCHCSDLISVCTRETFLLIFLDMSSVAANAQKICSTIRYNSNSLNRSVAIIGVTEEESQDFSSHGINDVIRLPVTDESMNQILLKWTGQKTCEGMPLTPESPEDSIQMVRKAVEVTKETDEGSSSLLSYSQDSHLSTSVQQNYDQHSSAATLPVAPQLLYGKPPLPYSTQSVVCYQQPFPTAQCTSSAVVTATSTRDVGLTPDQHATSSYRLHQPHNHALNVCAQPRFPHGTIHQDQPPLNLFQTRTPDYIPGIGQNTGLVNQVHPAHYNQGHVYHNVPPADQYRPHTVPQHFIPVNPCSVYPSTLVSNAGSFHSNNTTTSKTDALLSTQESPDCGGGKIVGSPAYMISGPLGSKDMKITLLNDDLSKHSSKERIRRERIKESCDQLRFLLPSITGKKSDMASILEMTVKYVRLVKDRLPASVIQEISDNISATTTVIPRKRPCRDPSGGSKQTRPRFTPLPKDQDVPPRLPHPIPPFYMRSVPLQAKAPTMVTTTGPVYLPHLHIRPGHEHTRIPIQHQADTIGFRPSSSPPSAFNNCHFGNNTGGAAMQHHPPRLMMNEHASMNTHQECTAPQAPFHHKHTYYNPITVPSMTNHTYEMPQQWSFLKLPPIGNIFHSLSSSNLSQGSVEPESSESGRSSPADSSMTPPLWESSGSMMMGREDQAHMEGSLLYKGASI